MYRLHKRCVVKVSICMKCWSVKLLNLLTAPRMIYIYNCFFLSYFIGNIIWIVYMNVCMYFCQKIDFSVDPVHGAMGCLSCKKCKEGVSYNRAPSFKECIPCKDCATIGRVERVKCSLTKNGKCGRRIKPTTQTKNNTAMWVKNKCTF